MMKRNKALSTILVSGLSLSLLLAGCGGGNNKNASPGNSTDGEAATASTAPATEAPKEVVELKAYFPGDKPNGFENVLKAVNDKLKADNVGASLNINFLPWSDYGN